jgi:hypothetical protein
MSNEKLTKDDYSAIFWKAKRTAVYGHAMMYITEVVGNKKLPDKDMFNEIRDIVFEAIDSLEEDDD